MTEYISVKPSQVHLFTSTPFYFQSKDGDFVLYKKSGDSLDHERTSQTRHPQLFILEKDKDQAVKELTTALNKNLARDIASGGFVQVKDTLCQIVHESLVPKQEKAMEALPETIEILLGGFNKDHGIMGYLTQIASNSSRIVEHTVNVTALTFQYCFYHKISQAETSRLGLCAMLHDVGSSKIEKQLIETNKRLTDKEFKTFTTHTIEGYDMVIDNTDFDTSIATVALEHHERLDGSGYPNGVKDMSMDSQLIGMIDSYEPLTYRNKIFRKAKKPFGSLQIIKKDVMEAKFSKDLFKNFASCLVN
ncbi:MAG: HD domain-containing protein [Desulfobacula sp.]|jgi:HD-GYP domain-containing protein (c-di-GMP phosphodiesterase class II)|nr:HD domain-containing protein [Desulfobacula sp.]